MSKLSLQDIKNTLQNVEDIYLQQSLTESEAIKNISLTADSVSIDIEMHYPAKSYQPTLQANIEKALQTHHIKNININFSTNVRAHSFQQGLKALPQVKNIIAVASGKGGVGKSTTAVNLALALKAEGANTAILDADIYGPSQPKMLGVSKVKPDATEDGKLIPVNAHGIQSMSIGYLVEEEAPMVWRGPMVTQALQQLLNDTQWQNVDYLIIDLPPGTGDTQLTLSQRIPVSGAIIVTTPQDIALIDAKKGLNMFEKVAIPILGIVENMSLHICAKCGNEEAIFGADGGKQMAKDHHTTFLGALPLEIGIRQATDEGIPTVVKDETSRSSEIYKEIAKKVAAKLSMQPKNMAFPNITIE